MKTFTTICSLAILLTAYVNGNPAPKQQDACKTHKQKALFKRLSQCGDSTSICSSYLGLPAITTKTSYEHQPVATVTRTITTTVAQLTVELPSTRTSLCGEDFAASGFITTDFPVPSRKPNCLNAYRPRNISSACSCVVKAQKTTTIMEIDSNYSPTHTVTTVETTSVRRSTAYIATETATPIGFYLYNLTVAGVPNWVTVSGGTGPSSGGSRYTSSGLGGESIDTAAEMLLELQNGTGSTQYLSPVAYHPSAEGYFYFRDLFGPNSQSTGFWYSNSPTSDSNADCHITDCILHCSANNKTIWVAPNPSAFFFETEKEYKKYRPGSSNWLPALTLRVFDSGVVG